MAGVRRAEGYRLPGAYQTLLAKERERASRPDPRWRLTSAGLRGEPAPPERMERSQYLADLEAGRPVTVPRWMIGGHSIPAPKDVALFRDRTITRFTVHPDDTIAPAEGDDAEG
jgi:hypothetical protein